MLITSIHFNEIPAEKFATFAAACSAGETLNKTIVVSSTLAVEDDLTVDRSLVIKPGVGRLTIASGKTLTINGPFQAGLYQVFDGDGSVVFGSGSVSEVYPEWWGADGVDDSVAIQQAINSLPQGFPDSGGTVRFTKPSYIIDTQITIGGYQEQGYIKFVGSQSPGYSARLVAGSSISATPMFYITALGIEFIGITFYGDGTVEGGTDATTVAIKVGDGLDANENPDNFRLTHCIITRCATGIELNSRNFTIRDNDFTWTLNPISIPGLEGVGPYDYLDRRDYFIERNIFHVCWGTCIKLAGTKTHSEVYIQDNQFKTCLHGIEGAVEDSVVFGNRFNNIKGVAINITTNANYTNAYSTSISNNIVSGYQGAGSNTGDAIMVKCPYPNVVNNKVTRKGGNGILVETTRAVIANNSVMRCTNHGIYAIVSNSTITGNNVMDNDNADSNTYSGIYVTGNYNIVDGNYGGNTTGTPGSGVGGQLYIVYLNGLGNKVGMNNGLYNKTAYVGENNTNSGFTGEGISRRVLTGTTPPSVGSWNAGDFVINKTPSVAGSGGSRYVIHGWICTVTGSPGTWVPARTLTGT